MNAHTKENCVENDDSAKLPVTGQYAYWGSVAKNGRFVVKSDRLPHPYGPGMSLAPANQLRAAARLDVSRAQVEEAVKIVRKVLQA
jgi:hypothetical protein